MDNHHSLVQQVLERYGLTDARTFPLRSYNNQVYRVEQADGQCFSLRICGFLNMQRSSMEDEMRWLDFVAQHNPRLAPRPIANKQGELITVIPMPEGERLSCLFAWIEGVEVRSALTPLVMFKIGQSMATLHTIAREFPFPDANSDFRGGYRYDQSLLLSHRDWIDKHGDAIGVENVALLYRTIDQVVAAMERIGTTPANYGMIHADLGFGNMLLHNEQLYIIDFEQLGRGHFLYDFAVLCNELRETTADFEPLWQSFVAGYGEVATLPFHQAEELQPFIIATQLNFLDWFYNSMTPTVRVEFTPQLSTTFAAIRQRIE